MDKRRLPITYALIFLLVVLMGWMSGSESGFLSAQSDHSDISAYLSERIFLGSAIAGRITTQEFRVPRFTVSIILVSLLLVISYKTSAFIYSFLFFHFMSFMDKKVIAFYLGGRAPPAKN
jgi:hypothetical protein